MVLHREYFCALRFRDSLSSMMAMYGPKIGRHWCKNAPLLHQTFLHKLMLCSEPRDPQKDRLLSDWNWTRSHTPLTSLTRWRKSPFDFPSISLSFFLLKRCAAVILLCEEWRAKIYKSALGLKCSLAALRSFRPGFMSCGHEVKGLPPLLLLVTVTLLQN